MDRQQGAAAGAESATPPRVTRDIVAEAAVWVARLHGPSRSRAMERECLAWQARSPAHRHAFERCTETWMDVPSVTVAGAYASADAVATGPAAMAADGRAWPVSGLGNRGRRLGLSMVAAAVASVAVIAWQPWQRWNGDDTYRTDVGELRTLLLADGTRLSLNTDTRVRVAFSTARRGVFIDRGEALFEVAPDAQRPFVVRAAGSEVVAVGTVFVVRLTTQGPGSSESVAVTLLEGHVSLRPTSASHADDVAPVQPVQMEPGERVRLVRLAKAAGAAAQTTQQIDRPHLDQVVAWTRSEALFENVSLADAVVEMNRYSRTPIVLTDGLADSALRVSGQFRAGDNAGFARAVAALHGLALHEGPGRLELAQRP